MFHQMRSCLPIRLSTRLFAQTRCLKNSPVINQENNNHTIAQPGTTILKHKYVARRHAKRIQKYELENSIVHRPHSEPESVLKSNEEYYRLNGRNISELLDNCDSEKKSDEHAEFPSDIEEEILGSTTKHRDQSKYSHRPEKSENDKTSILVFPGQGSQYVGMGAKLLQYPKVVEMYDYASSVLGYDLLRLCLNGPKEDLDKTVVCQPAVMVTSLAAVKKLRHDDNEVLDSCISVAGFSVGEYAALVFSGAMSFEDAIRVIKVRGEAMQEASELVDSGMMTVFTPAGSRLGLAMVTAREYCLRQGLEEPVCQVANYLFPQCKVIAGHSVALEFLTNHASEFGLRRMKPLPVSGAFHTELMHPAKPKLLQALKNVEFHHPKIPVHSNITSHRHRKVTLVKDLAKQIHKPVKWEQIVHVLYSRPQEDGDFPLTYEVGPGKQLGTLLKQVNAKAHERYHDIEC